MPTEAIAIIAAMIALMAAGMSVGVCIGRAIENPDLIKKRDNGSDGSNKRGDK